MANVTTEAGIGDVTSDIKGTGARFNAGKVPYDLISIGTLAGALGMHCSATSKPHRAPVVAALQSLGRFQAGGFEQDLYDVLYHTANAAGMPITGLFAETARVLEYGAKKYDAWNWAKGMPWQSVIACGARHLLGTPTTPGMWDDPTGIDPDSGLMHAGHVGCNVMFLLQFMRTYTEGDDRPKRLFAEPF